MIKIRRKYAFVLSIVLLLLGAYVNADAFFDRVIYENEAQSVEECLEENTEKEDKFENHSIGGNALFVSSILFHNFKHHYKISILSAIQNYCGNYSLYILYCSLKLDC